jgi:hypothetical protein
MELVGCYNLVFNGYQGPFPWVKRAGPEADHSPPSSVVVKVRMELYTYSLNTPSWSGT